MITEARRPPRPPVFPYTTLFRSIVGDRGDLAGPLLGEREAGGRDAPVDVHQKFDLPLPGAVVLEPHELQEDPDRKSTRLNSSHPSKLVCSLLLQINKRLAAHTGR